MNRRTSFITAAAVTGVVLAGTTAVAANIGILNSANSDNVGELSATTVVATQPVDAPATSIEPQIVDVYIEDPALAVSTTTELLVPETAPNDRAQVFNVEAAGTVAVAPSETGVVLDGVTAAEGWAWTMTQATPAELQVTFTSGDTTYVFTASLAADGTIAARVDQPIVQIVQAPAPSDGSSPTATSPSGGYDDDDHDDDDDDDHEDDDDHDEDEDEDDEHEGGDDDD